MLKLPSSLKAAATGAVRILAIIATLGAAAAAPDAARAQGLFVGSSADCDAFCVGGIPVKVERYEPTGLGHAFCGPRPAVIILHGADGLTQYGPVYREAAMALARAGYSAFVLHYFDITPAVAARGHVEPNSIRGPNFAAWQAAVAASIQWVSCQPGVDPCRVGLIGFSLGSYLALAEGARNPQVSVVVDFFGGVPPEAARLIRRMPPTLIIHGEADRIVPVTEAFRLRDVLASRGVPHEMVIYPGVGHELPGHFKQDAAQRVLRFLRCYL